ncbi:MAG TPA: VanZ family protein [Candidatus Limnocylindria bacterium]|nr:VanZ family protein [Candidatus Limnocylindria bacterium]
MPPLLRRRLILLATGTYIGLLLSLTLLPAPPDDAQGRDPVWLNLRPFDTINKGLRGQLGRQGPALVAGNVAAFVPLGVLVPLVTGRPSWRTAAFAGLSLSVAIESAQLGLSLLVQYPYRHADVDDVILNTSGAVLGYAAFRSATVAGDRLSRAT